MRIGFVIYGDIDARSGGFLYDREIVDRFRARGECEVLSLPWRETASRALADDLRSLLRDRDEEFDVFLQDELAHRSLSLSNRWLDTPTVALVHMLRWPTCSGANRRLARSVERRYLASVNGFVFNSRATRRAVESVTDPSPSVVAYPAGDRFGVETDAETVRSRAIEGPLRVVFLGNVIRRKGLDTLLEALARLEPPWRLTVVGDLGAEPGYTHDIRDLIGRLGIRDSVALAGGISDEALADVLRENHVIALPSRYEPFGIALLEGMSAGLVPLATTAGGPPEFVSHGESGLLVQPGSPETIAMALEALAADRERLATMGVAARERAARHPSWDETADRVHGLLRRVIR
ncbi:glycosyltransferase family 4 protein [Natronorarus salvus]|uniref:glycosyltransferase family 4 protein n=1 Tax=Natronorarus salvus TaxID=3117733 RepID=UPI002F2637C1